MGSSPTSGSFGLLEKRLVGRKKVNLPPVGCKCLLEVCGSPAVKFSKYLDFLNLKYFFYARLTEYTVFFCNSISTFII